MICLGRPDTATLCNEVASISDWRMLGLYLGVKDHELDKIERSHPTEGCGRWKLETISLWLRCTPSASWGDVVGALRRMGESTEAERLKEKFIIVPAHASKLYAVIPHLLGLDILSWSSVYSMLYVGMAPQKIASPLKVHK